VAGEYFDLIVANPPYVAAGDPHLELDGLPFEPRLALTARRRRRRPGLHPPHRRRRAGLPETRRLAALRARLRPGRGEPELIDGAAFKAASTFPDLAGIDRVSCAYL
jgi:release factor glutamine methyltransferase